MKTKIYIFMIFILFLSCWDNIIKDNEEVKEDNPVYVRSSGIVNNWRVLAMDVMPDDVSLDDAIEFTSTLVSNTATNASIVTDPDLLNNSFLTFSDNSAGGNNVAQFNKISIVGTNFTLIFRMRSINPGYLFFFQVDDSSNNYYSNISTSGIYFSEYAYTPYDTTQWHVYRVIKNNNNIVLYIDEVLFVGFSTSFTTSNNQLIFGDNNNSIQYNFEMDWLIWYDGMAFIPSANNVPSGLPGFLYP